MYIFVNLETEFLCHLQHILNDHYLKSILGRKINVQI
jgi:hypothetical protein